MTSVSHDPAWLALQRDVWMEILLAAVGEQLSEAVDKGTPGQWPGWLSVCVTMPSAPPRRRCGGSQCANKGP